MAAWEPDYYNMKEGDIMTKGDIEGKVVWGRPVKPLAGFMSLLMLVFTVFNILNRGVLEELWLGDIVAVVASIAAVCFWVGWFGRVQKMAEAGLLIAAFAYVTRASFIFFVVGPSNQEFWESLFTGGLVAAAFYLEASDPKNKSLGET